VKATIIIVLFIAIFGTGGYFTYKLFIKPHQMVKDEIAKGPAEAPPDPSLPEFQRCAALKKEKKLIEARTALLAFIENNPNSTMLEQAKDMLGETNTDIFFSSIPAPEKEQYVLQRGDALAKIEKKTKAPKELIMRTNNIQDPKKLQIGQILWIPHPDFSVAISRKERKLILLNEGKFFKQYHARIWKAPVSKNTAPLTGKVGEKIAYKDGQRVAFDAPGFASSARWIMVSIPGYTLYSENSAKEGVNPPAAGLGLSAEDMDELSTLLRHGIPVTVQ
jgi:LysM repeat protein